MDSSGSKSKYGVRKFVRKKANQLFKQGAAQGPLRVPSAQSPSLDPVPTSQTRLLPPGSVSPPATSAREIIACPSSVPNARVNPADAPATTIVEPLPSTGSLNLTDASPALAATSIDSPVHTTIRIATGVWGDLRPRFELCTEAPSYSLPFNQLLTVSKNRQEWEELASELEAVIGLLAEHMKPPTSTRMSGSIANFARGIKQQAKVIESKRERNTGRRLLDANADEEELARCYKRITSLFRQLQLDANLSVWSANTRLERLAPVKLANYDSKLSAGISRRTCTDGTRIEILAGLNDWSHDETAADIYWMNGMAGTGKTTIACSFSKALESREQLAASFSARATYPSAGSAKNITTQFDRLLLEPLLKVKEAIPSGLVATIDALDECDSASDVELLLSILLKHAPNIPLKFFVTSRPEPEIYHRMMTQTQGTRKVMHLHEVEKSLVQADIELYLTAELESMSPIPTEIEELTRRSGALFIYAATLVRYIGPHNTRIDSQRRLRSVLSMSLTPVKQYSAIDSLYAAILQATLEDEDLEPQEIDNIRCVLDTVVCIQEPVSLQQLSALTKLDDEGQTLSALQPLRAVIYLSETSGLVATLHASFPDFMFNEARSGTLCCNLNLRSGLIAQTCFELMKIQLRFNVCRLESSFVPDIEVRNIDDRVEGEISPALKYACRHWGSHLANSNYSDLLYAALSEFLSNRLLFWMEVLNLKQEIATGPGIVLKAKHWLQAGNTAANITRLAEDARKFVARFAANPISRSTPHIYISSLPFCPKSSLIYKQYRGMMKGLIDVDGNATQKQESGAIASWKIDLRAFVVAYSPDGTCIAVGCSNGTIIILNAHDGTPLRQLNQHTSSVMSIAYSPNGAYIVSGSRDKTVLFWDARCGTLLPGPLAGHANFVYSVPYSPDGTYIVSGSNDPTVRLWNACSNTHTTLDSGSFGTDGLPSAVRSVAYSPDRTRVVSGSSNGAIYLTKDIRERFPSVVYSPDGSRIASGSSDKTICLWIRNSLDITLVVGPLGGHSSQVSSVAYSPDGTCIVSGSGDKTIRAWSTYDGSLISSPLIGHTGSVWSVAYSPDGTRIISGSHDGSIRLWNAPDAMPVDDPLGPFSSPSLPPSKVEAALNRAGRGRPDMVLPGTHQTGLADENDITKALRAAADCYRYLKPSSPSTYSPDGSHIASGSESYIRVWDAHDGTLTASARTRHAGLIRAIAFSPDGTRIASAPDDRGSEIEVWDAQDATYVLGIPRNQVLSLTYSPDGTRIVCSSSVAVFLQDAHSGVDVWAYPVDCKSVVRAVAYSPDGARLVAGSDNACIHVFNAGDGTPAIDPLEGHTGSILSLSYSPDGLHIVSGSSDKTIRIWSACDGTPIAGPFNGHTDRVTSVAYSPDGTRIVPGSGDMTIRVSNANDGTLVAGPFVGHTGGITSVAFSPDGTRILSSCQDYTIRMWCADACTSAPTIGTFGLPPNSDGWVVGEGGELLLWVPSELVSSFITPSPRCLFAIANRDESLKIEFSGMLCGERWDQCYMGE